MSGVNYIRQKCKEKGISIHKLESDLGFSNGYLNPKKLKVVPYPKAVKISEYLGISLDRILDMPHESYYHVDPKVADIARKLYEDEKLMILFSDLGKASEQDVQLVVDIARRLIRDD